ncbi:MAG: (5-formylfuran-3-yl)methyl phosphate synthase [Pirellulales bacterium]
MRQRQPDARGGAGILDVKEPLQGSLGAAEWPVWKSIDKLCDKWQIPMSVAVGELSDPATLDRRRYSARGRHVCQMLACRGCEVSQTGRIDGNGLWPALPRGTQPVLVHYMQIVQLPIPCFEAILELLATDQPRAAF